MSVEDKTNNVFGLTVFNNGQFEVKVREVNGQLEFEIDGIAKSLGFSYIRADRNNKEFIRWKTVNEYLQGFGLSQLPATGEFIPEAYVYLLGMKASNNTAIDFQKWMAFDVIPSIRKHGCYIGEDADEEYVDNKLRFSTKRTIKTFATTNVSELNSLYEEFKAYMTSEYKNRTDVRIARYKSVEKGLEQLHDNIAKEDIANIGNCYNIRKLKEQVILDRTKLEKKSLGGDKAGKTKKIMALQDRLDFLDPDLEDFNVITCHGFSTNYMTQIGQDYVTGEPKTVTSDEYRKWQNDFPNSEFDEEIDIDWNSKIYLWLRFDALEKFDADNMIKSFQDQICRFYGTDDNKIEIREATINKNVTAYRDGRIYYILRNVGEVQ